MTVQSFVEGVLSGFLDFGTVVDSALDSAFSLFTTLRGQSSPDGQHEQLEGEDFGHAGVLWRPADPSAAGECELLVWRRGDEVLSIGSKDRRWQVSLDKGEVVIRAMSDSAALIRVKPDGSVVVDADQIKLGATAVEGIALGTTLQAHFATLEAWLAAHVHLSAAPSVPTGPPTVLPVPPAPTIASAAHKVGS